MWADSGPSVSQTKTQTRIVIINPQVSLVNICIVSVLLQNKISDTFLRNYITTRCLSVFVSTEDKIFLTANCRNAALNLQDNFTSISI